MTSELSSGVGKGEGGSIWGEKDGPLECLAAGAVSTDMRWTVLDEPEGELMLDDTGRCDNNDMECKPDVEE